MGNFNGIIFPKPEPSYKEDHPNLYSIPNKSKTPIPIIFLKNNKNFKKVLIYFHGNAEDINIALPFVDYTSQKIKSHAVIIEYPTYGVYKNCKLSENNINSDAEAVFDFLVNEMNFRNQDIILFGRSMGSGPATYLASQKICKYLLLFSPYTSIKEVSKDHVGLLSVFVKDRFKNIEHIEKTDNPLLVIHGKMDKIIPVSHSKKLFDKHKGFKNIKNPEKMTHNYFRIDHDLCIPMLEFEDSLEVEENKKKEINKIKNFEVENSVEKKTQIIFEILKKF